MRSAHPAPSQHAEGHCPAGTQRPPSALHACATCPMQWDRAWGGEFFGGSEHSPVQTPATQVWLSQVSPGFTLSRSESHCPGVHASRHTLWPGVAPAHCDATVPQLPWSGPGVLLQSCPSGHFPFAIHTPPWQMTSCRCALPAQADAPSVGQGQPRTPRAPVPAGVQASASAAPSAPPSSGEATRIGEEPPSPAVLASGEPATNGEGEQPAE